MNPPRNEIILWILNILAIGLYIIALIFWGWIVIIMTVAGAVMIWVINDIIIPPKIDKEN